MLSEARPSWKFAALWMAFLGPFFFLVYGGCLWITSQRSDVGVFYWEWERSIPFVPALIVPYMSLDLFYAGSVFLCRTSRELHTHARRIVFAILFAAVCFLVFPLRYAFPRPPTSGFFGLLFDGLKLDQPYNLVPSLHITLRSIVWAPYGRAVTGPLRGVLVGWFILIGMSTVLTYQHHVLDVLGGEILTVFTFYLFPGVERQTRSVRSLKVGGMYGAAAALLFAATRVFRPWSLILVWPAVSLALVAAAYGVAGPAVFRKSGGQIRWAARVLLGPFLLGSRLSLLYLRRFCRPYTRVTPGVLLGRKLDDAEAAEAVRSGITAVLDLTAEYDEADRFRAIAYKNIPVLDLTPPSVEQLREAVDFIREHAQTGKVYVHCALGYSRSACAAAAWLLTQGIAADVESALARIRQGRPQIVIPPGWVRVLEQYRAGLDVAARNP